MSSIKNAFYAQSGGVTAVINATACGVIETARRYPDQIGTVYAGHNGIIGALREELIDTAKISDQLIAALRYTPSGAFGSCRYKLQGVDENMQEYQRLIAVFNAHNIVYFFYNGGGDSADTCNKIAQLSRQKGLPIQAIHIPKTVDNDLPITDTCPGFGSVAKYVAIATREASYDVCSMAETSTKVFVLEVMGRHAGWIAAAAGLALDKKNDIPLIILFPEVHFNRKDFLAHIKTRVEKYGYCTIVVAEGVRWPNGQFLSEQGAHDAFGHAQLGGVAPVVAQLINAAYGYKYHWAVADYLQRSARHIASKNDTDQAWALGKAAVKMALAGENAIMPTIVRTSENPYTWEIGKAALADIANKEKKMPASYISEDGFGISEECRRYLSPLIEGEDYPPYVDGMPQYIQIKRDLIEKKLGPYSI